MVKPNIRESIRALADRTYMPEFLFQEKSGQWYGEFNQYRLRSTYRPVYHRSSATELALEGFKCTARMMASGHRYRLSEILPEFSPDDRLKVERLGRVVHCRNFATSGGGQYTIYLSFLVMTRRGLTEYAESIRELPGRLTRFGLNPEQMIFELSENSSIETDVLLELAETLRSMGTSIALTDFGSRQSSSSLLEDLEPDIVGIDPALLKKAVELTEAAELLQSLVDVATRLGVSVLVEGIDTSQELDVAMSTNAKLFRGDLLGQSDPRLFRARVRIETAPPHDAVA